MLVVSAKTVELRDGSKLVRRQHAVARIRDDPAVRRLAVALLVRRDRAPRRGAGPGFPDRVMTPVLASLWRGHGRMALVDAGAGACDLLWPGAAGLEAALARAGVATAR